MTDTPPSNRYYPNLSVHPPYITYTDNVEERLTQILESIPDQSWQSEPLRGQMTSWPLLYHLSHQRANILAPFTLATADRIVEIGAGCGAITRYLAEKGLNVTAIEGSLSRARIIAHRTADFPKIKIRPEDYTRHTPIHKYDVALSIGVLEYAPRFERGESKPGLTFLRRTRNILSDDGILILAIENQMGLKYLLGYPEDHTGIEYDGLQGYEHTSTVQTYSHKRLSELLAEAGFPYQSYLYPFPDYKLPQVIFSHSLISTPPFSPYISDLLRQPVLDQSAITTRVCDTQKITREVLNAGLLPSLSNSFLVICSSNPTSIVQRLQPDVQAWLFSNSNRKSCFAVETQITKQHMVIKKPHIRSIQRKQTWLNQRVADSTLIEGNLFSSEFMNAARSQNSEYCISLLSLYHTFLLDNQTHSTALLIHPFSPTTTTAKALPPNFLDALPHNLIINSESLVYFDREWEATTDVDLDLIYYRGCFTLAKQIIFDNIPHPWTSCTTTQDLTQTFYLEIVHNQNIAHLHDRFMLSEPSIQALVTTISNEDAQIMLLKEFSSTAQISLTSYTLSNL